MTKPIPTNPPLRFKQADGTDYPDWRSVRLGDVFKISAGGDIEKSHVSNIKTEQFKYPIYANSDKNEGAVPDN